MKFIKKDAGVTPNCRPLNRIWIFILWPRAIKQASMRIQFTRLVILRLLLVSTRWKLSKLMKVSTSFMIRQNSPNMPSQRSKPRILERSLLISMWQKRIHTGASLTKPTRIKSISNDWCRKSRQKVLQGLLTHSHPGLISTTMSVRLFSNKSKSQLKKS